MENNLNQSIVNNTQPVPTPTIPPVVMPTLDNQPPVMPSFVSQPQNKGSKKKIVLVVLIVLILGALSFAAFSYFNSSKVYNAGVYRYPTSSPTTPTPTEIINQKDTTDSAIDSDSAVINKELDGLNSDISGVDQGINDKQTNLQ